MKHKNKNIRRLHERKTNRNGVSSTKITNRKCGQINRTQRNQAYQKSKRLHTTIVRDSGPVEYIFYAVLNTALHMNQGTAAATIANGLMSLYNQLDFDQVKCQYIDVWKKQGRRIIVLKGYDHKHLKYLEGEIKFLAIGTHTVRQAWSRNKAIIALATFGRREDLEEAFEGLSYLR